MHVLGALRRNTVALDRVVYFAGPGLRHLSSDARFAMCNMCAELGAIGGVCEADAVTLRTLRLRLQLGVPRTRMRPPPTPPSAATATSA